MRHGCEFLFFSWKSSQQPRAALVQQRHVLVGEMTRNILVEGPGKLLKRFRIWLTTKERQMIVQEIPELADKDS